MRDAQRNQITHRRLSVGCINRLSAQGRAGVNGDRKGRGWRAHSGPKPRCAELNRLCREPYWKQDCFSVTLCRNVL